MSQPSMNDLLKQAHEFQEKLAKAQEGLKSLRAEGSAGGGMVTVAANGKKEVLEVRINKSSVDLNDVELLEDLIVAAVNQALSNAEAEASVEMKKAAGGVIGNLAGSFKIPGL